MFECTFIYRFKTGGNSDSINQKYKVHVVPRVGESIDFIRTDGNSSTSVVKEVAHYIHSETGIHEIYVFYGDE